MAKRTQTSIEIPLELVMEILVKLPVKSLCRFQCVSKLWHSAISDPYFVEAHHAFSSHAHPRLLFFFPQLKCHEVKSSLCSEDFYYKYETVGAELYCTDYPHHSDGPTRTLDYCQSICNPAIACGRISHPVQGLYCVDLHDHVKIWNPTTGEHLDIKIEMKIRPYHYIANYFGFDPVQKKHKILSISVRRTRRMAIESRVFVVEENRWRNLNNHPPEIGDPHIQKVICIDGIIYSAPSMRSNDQNKLEQVLVLFHVGPERFQRIPIPEEAQHTDLIGFAGRATLADTLHLLEQDGSLITLWMLEDLEHRTWTSKTCSIRWGEDYNVERMVILHGGTPAGELLLTPQSFTEPFLLFLYHVESDTLRRIELQGIPESIRQQDPYETWMMVRFHVDRLQEVPLKRRLGSRPVTEIGLGTRKRKSLIGCCTLFCPLFWV